ncbi:MAG: carboxymuconolactone decarboxylase family protein, partial [Candidatus Binataceae bacterium]
EEKIAKLRDYRNDSAFSPRERVALEFAERMALDHASLDDDFFKRLRAHFNDAEVVELGMAIGQYIGFGRLLMVLDLERPVCEI